MALRAFLLPMLLLVPAAAADAADPPSQRTVSVVVYGDDPCPRATGGDEIVVCARRPDNERYRIPKELRKKEERPSEVSWASRVAGLEDAQRYTRPDSCSPVGTWGQTGCFQQMISQWLSARQQARSQAANIP